MPATDPESRAATMRAWRAKNPSKVVDARKQQRLRERAMRELAKRHPKELAEIIVRLERLDAEADRKS